MSDPIQLPAEIAVPLRPIVGPFTISEDDVHQAHQAVFSAGYAGTLMLQRKLKIGYGRASELIKEMERRGMVGPFKHGETREVLRRPNTGVRVRATTGSDVP